ncbi:MAG: SMP-30/gluconolactonase/LRE family protein [Alphaproteobacteria bacterium]|nr:SMP-30/gluconolactonase/LRE family protein [Alphaproteobacteria bacterium]
MFAPPPVIETKVFVDINAGFGITDSPSEWAGLLFGRPDTPSFLEGPSFDRDGNLWLVDVARGRLFRVTPDGDVTVAADYEGEPNGLAFHRDGHGLIADHYHGIMHLDPESGRVEPYCVRNGNERFLGTNDLTFASNGDLYFTDQGTSDLIDRSGRVFRLRADGTLDLVCGELPSPNGLVLSADERILFVGLTRDNAVWRMRLRDDGAPADQVGRLIRLSGGTGPDGMAADADGNILVCHVGFGTVWIFSPTGAPLFQVKSCKGPAITNCAYGGPDNRTLYITESSSGCVLTADLPVAGRPLYSHM